VKKMDSFIRVEANILNGKSYWKLVDLPHVKLQADSIEDLSKKVQLILPSYFKMFPSEIARILEVPEMMIIPLKM